MMNSLLDFRTLLCSIAIIYEDKEFTARELSKSLMEGFSRIYSPKIYRYLLRVRPKLISNDLRRLYSMGLLKRRRVKRQCKTNSGKVCFRGYEYKYSISSQGWKYIGYLYFGKQEEDFKKAFDIIIMMKYIRYIRKKVPEDMQDIAWELHKLYFSGRKGYRRFLTSKAAFWDKFLEKAWEYTEKKRKIEKLKKEIEELKKENERLKNLLKDVLKKLKRYWEKGDLIALGILIDSFPT